MTELPAEAFAVAFSLLPGCGQQRLRSVLTGVDGRRDLAFAWRATKGGHLLSDLPDLASALGPDAHTLAAAWAATASMIDLAATWRSVSGGRQGVWMWSGDGYPAALADDLDPPPLLFWAGEPSALEAPIVGIVGTRRCTAYGSEVAREFGRDLALAGVAVVSGLALGVDGAAHEGALAGVERGGAAPIAVVGSGLDVVYPQRHRPLWRRVGECGLLLSESPPGAPPDAWRFPRRNRIIAALSRVVVVIESHAQGGSLSTVRAATDRGIPVMAVPGSIRSPSSAGTNKLLSDGVAPAIDAADVLVALSLEGIHLKARAASTLFEGGAKLPGPSDPALDPAEIELLAAVDWAPTSTEKILRRTGFSVAALSAALVHLEVRGLIQKRGSWWERAGASLQPQERGYTARQ